jgi:hypothetical protein
MHPNLCRPGDRLHDACRACSRQRGPSREGCVGPDTISMSWCGRPDVAERRLRALTELRERRRAIFVSSSAASAGRPIATDFVRANRR